MRRRRRGRSWSTRRRRRRRWRRVVRRSRSPARPGRRSSVGWTRVSSRRALRRIRCRCRMVSTRSRSVPWTGRGTATPHRDARVHRRLDGAGDRVRGRASGADAGATPSFGFASSPPGATFECAVDDGALVACTSPHTTAELADGRHTFAVRAVGANPDPTPAVLTFRVDATAPPTAITPARDGAVTAGRSCSGSARTRPRRSSARSTTRHYGSCSITYRAEDLALGEHVYRARGDRPGGERRRDA